MLIKNLEEFKKEYDNFIANQKKISPNEFDFFDRTQFSIKIDFEINGINEDTYENYSLKELKKEILKSSSLIFEGTITFIYYYLDYNVVNELYIFNKDENLLQEILNFLKEEEIEIEVGVKNV